MAAGGAQIGVCASMQTLLQAIGHGNDFVLLGTDFQVSPGGLLSLPKRPVLSVKDLPGLVILGQQGIQPQLDALYRLNGLKPDFRFVPTGYDPSGLLKGQGNAYTCFVTNQPITLEETYHLSRGTGYDAVLDAVFGGKATA